MAEKPAIGPSHGPGQNEARVAPSVTHKAAAQPPASSGSSYANRPDAMAFGRELANQSGLDSRWVLRQLGQARFQLAVTRAVMPPPAGVRKDWSAYRARFLDARRLQEGLRWWSRHEAWLQEAQARWGVPASVIVAIVGIESFYGQNQGNFRVLDALSTLSFDFPSGRSDRSSFYREELSAFLRWCAAEHRDPTSVRGSYAGAMGLPQFMPSSVLKFAVDFDRNGRIDLSADGADVVGSVARYLADFGWQRDLNTHFEVAPPADDNELAYLLGPDIRPSWSPADMLAHGAFLESSAWQFTGKLALVELQNGDAPPVYRAGTRNFYAITRYNWSAYYAMAVIDLARALTRLRPPAPEPGSSSTAR